MPREPSQRDIDIELGAAGAIDLAHATFPKQRHDFENAEPRAGSQRHRIVWSQADYTEPASTSAEDRGYDPPGRSFAETLRSNRDDVLAFRSERYVILTLWLRHSFPEQPQCPLPNRPI
jgi:hypothetical protein